jgi:VWFA-related protein
MRPIVFVWLWWLVTTAVQQVPVYRSTSEAVIVDVSVRRQGRPVPSLTADDFELLDNGVAQTIADISVEKIPIEFVVLVDRSASIDRATASRIRTAASGLTTMMRPGDRYRIVRFASVTRAVKSAEELDSGDSPVLTHTVLFDSLLAVVMQPVETGWRRVVIVLSDGIDTASTLDHSLRAAILDRSSAVVHLLAIAQARMAGQVSGATERTFRKPNQLSEESYSWVLRDVVNRTGGRFYDLTPDHDFVPVLQAAIEESRTRYVLRYNPAGVDPTGWHVLRIKVRGGDYDIRHRPGYWRTDAPR